MSSRGDVKQANITRGTGVASRLPFSNERLKDLGWQIENRGKGFKWINTMGKSFYSSKAVQDFLDKDNGDASDSEYEPTTDDCLSSPEKQQVPLLNEGYHARKRLVSYYR